MRSEKEMLELICGVARSDPRIRAAYLEGSRVNPNVPKDIFQDYDVGYLVSETKSFRDDKGWIDRFGERLYMQYPEENSVFPSDMENCYGWLMQFADGIRLDLHVRTLENVRDNLELYRVLVDKDGLLPKEADLSDERYWVKKPAQEEFSFACNEFWWCLNNVAKGLWRWTFSISRSVLCSGSCWNGGPEPIILFRSAWGNPQNILAIFFRRRFTRAICKRTPWPGSALSGRPCSSCAISLTSPPYT